MQYTQTLNELQNYEALNKVLQDNNILLLNTGAEIGTRDGDTTAYLLKHNEKLSMITVDPYTSYLDVHEFVTEEMQAEHLERATKQLSVFKNRVTIKKATSASASKKYENGLLDFVFIDAEHSYGACYTDCTLWYPKIRKGGLLCGHDYGMNPVNTAITQFARENFLTVYHVPYLADIWFAEKV